MKQMVQQIAEPVVNVASTKTLLYDAFARVLAFDAPSSDYLAKRLNHLLVKSTEWLLESSNRLKQSRMLGK